MSLRTSFQKLIRRDPAASLRERAAATASRIEAFKPALPEPAPAEPTTLVQACDQALVDWNAIQPKSKAENWGDEELDEALDAYDTVFQRAINEPSHDMAEIQAKARLLLHDLIEHTTGHDPSDEATLTVDERLTRVVLREFITLSRTNALPPSTTPTDWFDPPPGFMASPAIEPTHFALIPHALRVELDRLHCIAQREFDRQVGPDTAPERQERLRRLLKLDIFEAASLSGDAEILTLGMELDAVHARWRASVPAYNDAQARLSQAERYAKAQGKHALAAHEAAWDEPGVREAMGLFEDIGSELERISRAIWRTPARTPLGLAVKARATLVMIFTSGQYEHDSDLGQDEDLTEQSARHLIEACCAFAGVNWKGELTDGTTLTVPPAEPVDRAYGLAEKFDFKAASLRELRTIHDRARSLSGVAYDMSCQGACQSGDGNPLADHRNAVGRFLHELGDALTDVESRAADELEGRQPASIWDRRIRLGAISERIIFSGDDDETAVFLQELTALAVEQAGR